MDLGGELEGHFGEFFENERVFAAALWVVAVFDVFFEQDRGQDDVLEGLPLV